MELRRRLLKACYASGPKQYTITVYPSSLDDVNSTYESYTNLNNAFDSGSASNYASFYWNKGASAETFVYLNFDLSAIPDNATIIEVSGQERVNTTGYQSSRWLTRGVFLTSGTTQKSNSQWTSSLTAFNDAGTWTVAELHNAKLCYYIKRRDNSYNDTSFYMYVYGGSITVTYEV